MRKQPYVRGMARSIRAGRRLNVKAPASTCLTCVLLTGEACEMLVAIQTESPRVSRRPVGLSQTSTAVA